MDQVVEREGREVEDYEAPPLRTFEITFSDRPTERYTAHFFDIVAGHLVFLDEVWNGTFAQLFYRRAVPAGTWADIQEVSTPASTLRVN